MADDTPIGRQLQKLRRDASLTQEQLAERAGVSVDLIGKLERGARASASLVSLTKLATALDVGLSELVDKRPRLDRGDNARVLALRDAILEPSVLPGIPDDDRDSPAPAEVERLVRAAWVDYWTGHLTRLAVALPGLLSAARGASREGGAVRALTQSYQLAACLCVHLGKDDLATMAAERAVTAASTGDDRLLWATANGTYAWALHHQGRLDVAERHALQVAEAIEPDFARAPLPHLTVWGGLVLTGLASAAAAERSTEVREYLSLASVGAARFEADRHDYETNFGKTQVSMQATHAWTMLGKPDRALKAARDVDRADLRDISWGRHLLDKASAHVDSRHLQAAEVTLAEAAALSPEWFRHQGPARSATAELAHEARRLSPRLRSLVRTVGLDR